MNYTELEQKLGKQIDKRLKPKMEYNSKEYLSAINMFAVLTPALRKLKLLYP